MRKNLQVALVRGNDRRVNIKKALSLIAVDFVASYKKAKTILIKPNLTSAYNPVANTSSEAIEAIVDFLKDHDSSFSKKKIVVCETSGEAFSRRLPMSQVFQRFGYDELPKKYSNVSLVSFAESKTFCKIPIATFGGEKFIRIPKEIFKFDYKISVALPKTHDTVVATLGIKNFLMGVIADQDKSLMHGFYLSEKETASYSAALGKVLNKIPWQILWLFNQLGPKEIKDFLLNFDQETFSKSASLLHHNLFVLGRSKLGLPDLVVIDGLFGMEADGPVYGKKRQMNFALASANAVNADALGAKLMGFDPLKIGYLRLLAEKSKLNLTSIKVVGEKPEAIAGKFIPHRHLQYTRL